MKIRQDFERNRDTITDLSVMNVMLLKNHQEYQETMNVWKQVVGCIPHVFISCGRLIFPIVAPCNALVQKVRQSASTQNFPRKVLC